MEFKHLALPLQDVITRSESERIEFIRQPKWIGYTAANDILNSLDETMAQPKTHRMKNLLIVGQTNNGKTMIINRFLRKYPSEDNVEADNISCPVLSIQAPPVPDESRLYNNILEAVFALYNPKEHVSTKQLRVINVLKKIGTRIIIIDELHHILSDTLNKQRKFLNVLKFISNELQVPLVGVGTKDALRAIQSDPQLENRFEPVVLPKWKVNNDYKKLLASFEALMPLKEPSYLSSNALSAKLHMISEGTIGELSNIISKLAIEALKRGEEKITMELIDTLDLMSPTQRRRIAASTIT